MVKSSIACGGGGGGSGDVAGPASSVDNEVARFDGTGGKTIQAAGLTISDVSGDTVTITAAGSGATTHLIIRSEGDGFIEIDSVGTQPIYFKTNGAGRWRIDSGGALQVTNATSRLILQGDLSWKGKTESALPPTTSNFASGEIGIHKDTNLNKRQLVWNDGGILYGIELPAL